MKIRYLICMVIVYLALSANTNIAFADQGQNDLINQTITFGDLGYTKDETLKGILVSRDYTIRWPNAWEVGTGNTLVLDFSHSSELDTESSMAIDWNGTRLTSTLLTQENADHGSIEVALPPETITTGYNQLSIKVYMGLNDEDYCQDVDNLAVWLTIHTTSRFIFSYSMSQPALDLSLYPLPLIDNSDLVENNVTFILPENPTINDIQAAVRVSAKLGQLVSWRKLNINTLIAPTEEKINQLTGDIVLIGEYDRIKSYSFVAPPTNIGVQKPGRGAIWLQNSPGDPSAVILILSGVDEAALNASGVAMANEKLFSRLSGQIGFVETLTDPTPEKITYQDKNTFEQLGYPDRVARGVIEQKINYNIRLSMEWQVLTEGILDLHFAYSELLDSEKSSMTLLINDVPFGSVRLTANEPEDALASIKIPASLFEIGNNTLSIVTDTYLPLDYKHLEDCTEDYLSEAWLVIYSDSSITLPGGPSDSPITLKNYPVAFTGSDNLADLAFVIPDLPGNTIINATVQIASGIGTFADGYQFHPYVITPSSAEYKNERYKYQVFVGRPTQNQAIFDINDSLPQPFEARSDTPTDIQETTGIVPPQNSTGYIQATKNLEGYPCLIVTGTDDTGVFWASMELGISGDHSTLDGDLAILDGPGKVYSTQIHKEASATVNLEEEPVTEVHFERTNPSWVLLISYVLIGISVVTLVVVFLIEFAKRNK
jgi:hypothetical protein